MNNVLNLVVKDATRTRVISVVSNPIQDLIGYIWTRQWYESIVSSVVVVSPAGRASEMLSTRLPRSHAGSAIDTRIKGRPMARVSRRNFFSLC